MVSALTIYNIDPFRVLTIDNEQRTLVIAQEPRKFTVDSEDRINTIEAESRSRIIPSESRKLQIQHLTLVEVEGNPLDRRES